MSVPIISVVSLMIMLLVGAGKTAAEASADASEFQSKVVRLYSFEPHTLTSDQIQAKSAELDEFWSYVKRDPNKHLPFLRAELRNPNHSAFFYYDGSKLLLSLSQERDDQSLALASIPRADLRGIQHTDYLLTVHWFARNGFNTTKAALRILDYPDFKAFIVQHVLTLGQNYSLIYMLFPMQEANYLVPLIERLQTERQPVSQKSLLLALWYSMTQEARTAIARFAENHTKPQESRDYAKQLLARKAPLHSTLSLASVKQLKEERQKVMYRVSDEALHEFESLSAQLLAEQ